MFGNNDDIFLEVEGKHLRKILMLLGSKVMSRVFHRKQSPCCRPIFDNCHVRISRSGLIETLRRE